MSQMCIFIFNKQVASYVSSMDHMVICSTPTFLKCHNHQEVLGAIPGQPARRFPRDCPRKRAPCSQLLSCREQPGQLEVALPELGVLPRPPPGRCMLVEAALERVLGHRETHR